MDQKSSNQKASLNDLPGSEDKEFWEEAEVHTNLVAEDFLKEHKHFLNKVRGNEAYCEGCGWGFQLDPGDEIRDGHLYNKTGKYII